MSVIKFTCTSLEATNKKGILPVDENGYQNKRGNYHTKCWQVPIESFYSIKCN